MASVSTYLNFPGTTEEAFVFYRSVFGGEFLGRGIMRYGDMPPAEGAPPMTDEHKKMVMHVELITLGDHAIMGSDAPASMGHQLSVGNNVYINLEPDSRAETERMFKALSAGGTVISELKDMFWGTYYGCCCDRFGIQWMFNCNEKL